MYLKLKSQYALRGWNKAPYAIIRRPDNTIKFLSQDEFQKLIICDGETEITDEFKELGFNEEFLNYNSDIIEVCDTPTPLDEDQYYKYYENRYVENIFWSVTGKCNFRCRHCFMDAPDAAFGELNTQEALKLIDEMNECGVLKVDLTGGEPLVRSDFWQLIDRMVSYKIDIANIYTNGWLVNDKLLDKFEERGLKPVFHFSFDGLGWHDWMRGIKGAEDKTIEAIKLCVKRGYRVGTQMCVHKGNVESIPETMKVLGELGAESIKFGDIALTDLWCKNSEGNTLNWKEFLNVMIDSIPKIYEIGRPITANFAGLVKIPSYKIREEFYLLGYRTLGDNRYKEGYLCSEARFASYVGPDGRMLPCLPMTAAPEEIQSKFPMVQNIGLKKALSDGFYMEFVDKRVGDLLEVNKKCAACGFKHKCGGGCRATAVLDGNCDLMGCDTKLCELYHGDYIERARKIVNEMNKKYGIDEEV